MVFKHSLTRLKNMFVSEIILITCFLSAFIYWIYEVHFRIHLFSISKLLVLYLIIIPPVFLISPKGVGTLKKIFKGHHAALKILIYLIFTAIFYYSLSLQNKIFPLDEISVSSIKQFIITVLIYTFAITWKPLLFAAGFYALKFFNEKEELLNLNWQIVLLFLAYFILKKMSYLYFYNGIGEPNVRAGLAQLLALIIHMPDINFLRTPVLMKYCTPQYLESWIYLLTLSLLLPQFIHLKDIGIRKIENPLKIFKLTPNIWIYFIVIILLTLFRRHHILAQPMTLVSLFYYVFLRALFEEICFRGVLQTCFVNMFKKLNLKMSHVNIIAIFLSATLFVLYHDPFLRVNNTLFIFVFGLLTGRLVYKTQSIIPGLMVHTAINMALLRI